MNEMKTMRHIGTGTFKLTHAVRANIEKVLQSGQLSYGQFSKQFEHSFARMHGCKYAVLSNSGTSSLLVALQALKEYYGWSDGDEVLVPALTFVATVNVVLQAGLRPVLVDIDPVYYDIDASKIEAAITAKTKCIIPVHAFGQPCNMSRIHALAKRNNITVLEDSCEAMGVQHDGRSVGAWGEIGCFSTYMAHLITTGVGGLSTTNNPELAKIMRSLVNHGLMYSDLTDDGDYNPVKIHRDFVFERVGHSFRITELEAAIGLAQLTQLTDFIAWRRHNANKLCAGLWDLPLQLPAVRDDSAHAYMMFPIVVISGNRDDLTRYLNEHGISTRRMLPLVSQPVYSELDLWNPDHYPNAQWVDDYGLYVGCHQNLTEQDLNYVIETFRNYFIH